MGVVHIVYVIDVIAEVKKLIVEYKLTKGDIRGKAIKQLMGE